MEEDPEYYKKLSERLKDIIKLNEEKWDELVQLLLNFRNEIEKEHKQDAIEEGLTETEFAFYNILIAELNDVDAKDNPDKAKVKEVVKSLVDMFNEATEIVDFFKKWDEQKRIKREIKRIIIANFEESIVKNVTERFMDLVKVKFS